jgi:pimeloyl-ACP methyl ester carboxylesterase
MTGVVESCNRMRQSIIAILLFIACSPVTAHPRTAPSVDPNPSHYMRPSNQTGPFKPRVIVFVHGMFANSDEAWRYSSQVYWPSLLLSDPTFGDSDIYVAAYPTPFVGGRMNLEDVVSNLENRLTADRVFSQHREVVFVCHSLGGLVVEKLLLKNRNYDRQVPFIYFFGTPQTGADIASIGKLLGDPLFKDLSANQDNEVLQGIEDEWRAARLKIRSYCAYERKPILGQLVVDRLSATRNCTEPPVAIDETHIGMVKPSGTKHDSYIALVIAARDHPIRETAPHTQSLPGQEAAGPPFAFAAETMITSWGSGDFIGFWLPARDLQGCAIEPIDDLVFLRVTNNGSGSRMIVNYSLETKQKDGWSPMNKKELGPSGFLFFTLQGNAVPAVGVPIPFKANGYSNKYFMLTMPYGNANVKQAGVVQVQSFDVVAGSQNLTQGQSVRGWAAFQHQGLPDGELRMKITDELGKIYTVPQTLIEPGPTTDITQHPILIQSLTDVSGCRQKADF